MFITESVLEPDAIAERQCDAFSADSYAYLRLLTLMLYGGVPTSTPELGRSCTANVRIIPTMKATEEKMSPCRTPLGMSN